MFETWALLTRLFILAKSVLKCKYMLNETQLCE